MNIKQKYFHEGSVKRIEITTLKLDKLLAFNPKSFDLIIQNNLGLPSVPSSYIVNYLPPFLIGIFTVILCRSYVTA